MVVPARLFAAVVGKFLEVGGGIPVTDNGFAVSPPPRSIYLAGPMRGIPCFNFPAFYAAEEGLTDAGWIVYNPARHDNAGGFDETANDLSTFDMRAAFRWDVDSIFASDAIYMLKGWEKSVGATTELGIAKMLDLEILYEVTPTVCSEAESLIHGARNSTYGHPYSDFSRTAGMWSALLGVKIEPEQVPLMMIAVKMSRLSNGYHRDSNVDIAGYAGTLEMVVDERKRREELMDGYPA